MIYYDDITYYIDFKRFCLDCPNMSLDVNPDGQFLAIYEGETVMICDSFGIHIENNTFYSLDECMPFLMKYVKKERLKEITGVDL